MLLSNGDVHSIKHYLGKIAKDDFLAVDVGTYTGGSCSVICSVLRDYKNVKVHTVDHYQMAASQSIVGNMEQARRLLDSQGVLSLVELHNYDSTNFASNFNDNSVDFVFIDADHTYQKFLHDLEVWYPKVKSGGILCGHDYDKKFVSADDIFLNKLRQVIDEFPNDDVHRVPMEYVNVDPDYRCNEYDNGIYAPFPGICMHGGIVLGLHDFFGNDFETLVKGGNISGYGEASVWAKFKE